MTTNETAFSQAKSVIPGGVDSPVRAFGGVGGLFLIALAIIWLTDKPEPEPIPASEREYTGFEDGFPVPPLPGQTPVASPRGLATIEGELATASAIDSPKESTDE